MTTSCVWFRKCLRVHDNAALLEAAKADTLLPLYVLDRGAHGPAAASAARCRFLLEALGDLDASLRKLGSRLVVVEGDPEAVATSLIRGECAALPGVAIDSIAWEREPCEPSGLARDARVLEAASKAGVAAKTFDGHGLWDTERALEVCGARPPTKMPAMLALAAKLGRAPAPLAAPAALPPPPAKAPDAPLPDLSALGHADAPGRAAFGVVGGESVGLKRLGAFMAKGGGAWARAFEKPRTFSARFDADPSTTVLSPYVSHGCVSARTFKAALDAVYAAGPHAAPPTSLLGQLYFREMAYLQGRKHGASFARAASDVSLDIDWDDDAELVEAWATGRTGYPFIDAVMRQLVESGWIHHLARHAAACFLTRGDLYAPWPAGAAVFEKHLLDYDWAMNNFNWLGLAGVSPWSPPYFRVYSPIPNHKTSSLNVDDKDGKFVDRYVPELRKLPAKYKYEPGTAPKADLRAAGVELGTTYPRPIFNHKTKSKDNIARFKAAAAADREAKAAAGKKRKAGA